MIDENLDTDRLYQTFENELASIPDEDMESITRKNAVVEASLEYEEAPNGTQRYLTAPENGDWLIVV